MNASGNGSARSIAVRTVLNRELEKAGTKCTHSASSEADSSSNAKREQVDLSLLDQQQSAAGPVVPRVQCSCSRWHLPQRQCRQTTMRMSSGIGSQLPLRRRRQPKRQLQKHYSSGGESKESTTWYLEIQESATWYPAHAGSNPRPSSTAAGMHTNNCPRAVTKTRSLMTSSIGRSCMTSKWQQAVPLSSHPKGEWSIFARNVQHQNGDASQHIGGGEGMKSAPVVTPLRSPSPQLLLKGSALGRTKGYHPISSHMSRSPISATFTSSSLTTTTILFPAPPSDNPTTLSRSTPQHEQVSIYLSVTHSLWLKSSLAWSGNQRHGGYAGIRVGEAVNPGPATRTRLDG